METSSNFNELKHCGGIKLYFPGRMIQAISIAKMRTRTRTMVMLVIIVTP
jgi:hypothetical protein